MKTMSLAVQRMGTVASGDLLLSPTTPHQLRLAAFWFYLSTNNELAQGCMVIVCLKQKLSKSAVLKWLTKTNKLPFSLNTIQTQPLILEPKISFGC